MSATKRIPEFIWGRKYPKISVDRKKCTIPFQCKKCLQICPELVFHVVRDMKQEKRLEEMDPRIDGTYMLFVSRRDKCTTYNLCTDICPVDAISIEVPEQESFQAAKRDPKWEQS